MPKHALFLLLSCSLPAMGAHRVGGSSRVSEVTLFHDRAFVTRTQHVSFEKGALEVAFTDVTPLADTDSFRVTLGSRKSLTLMAVRTEPRPEAQARNPEVRALESKRDALLRAESELRDEVTQLTSQSSDLTALAEHYRESFSLNLHQNTWSRDQFRGFVRLLLTQSGKLSSTWRKVYEHLETNHRDLESVQARLQSKTRVSDRRTITVLADFLADENVGTDVQLQYLVREAGWSPLYDLRLDPEHHKASLEQNAAAWQNSGEDWDQVRLSLSNVPSELHPVAPTISRYILSYSEADKVQTSVAGTKEEAQSLQNSESPDSPAAEKSLAKSFRLPLAQTLRDTPSRTKLFLQRKSLSYDEHLELVAADYPHVFLKVELANPFDWDLPSGPLAVYTGGSYVQQTWLPSTPRRGPLSVNTGVDGDCLVEYWKKDSRDEAGMIDRRVHHLRQTKTTLRNVTDREKQIKVMAQTPISELKDVEVSTKGSTEGLEPERKYEGWMYWNVTLPPREKKVVELKLDVAAPKSFPFQWD